ncbi:MAG: hypothetical protein J7M38_08160 [Armatimonadetes bacterium]|nr:hypothetical protein [Armatimonadota bacterium]
MRAVTSAALIAPGLAAGVAQVLLLRELLTVAYGNELSLGVLLACWLICGALGSLLARRLARPDDTVADAARRMILLAALPAPMLIMGVLCARAGLVFYSSILPHLCGDGSCPIIGAFSGLSLRPGEAMDLGRMLLLGLAVAVGPAAVDGAQFAIGADLFARTRSGRKSMGAAYALDATGHLIGGVLLAWVVVMAMNPFAVATATGLINLAVAFALARVVAPDHRGLAWVVSSAAVALIIALPVTSGLQRHSLRWRFYQQQLLTSRESIYGNITVTRQKPDGIYLYQSGVYSGASPPLVGTIDNFVHFALLQHPRPRRVLIIGGGVPGGLAEVLRHNPEEVVYVELDGTLFDIAHRWGAAADVAALDDPRVTARQGDGRRVLTHCRSGAPDGTWDIILLCMSDPSTAQLNRFYTVEFYRRARAALNRDGILAWQIPGSDGYFGASLLRLHTCLLGTARTVFPHMVRMPEENTACVAGGSDYLTDDWRVLQARLYERGIEVTYLEAVLSEVLRPWTLDNVARTLAGAPPQPLNRDLHPIGYFFDQAWWTEQFHPNSVRLFALLERLSLLNLIIPALAVAVVLWLLSPIRRVSDALVPLSVALTGMISMGMEVVLLFAFQSMYGYVYHMVGVIVGAFMIGVAAGSMGITRWLTGKSRRAARAGLALAQLAMAALAAGIALLLSALWGSAAAWFETDLAAGLLFPFLTALVGLGVGVQFPLATNAWCEEGETARAAAGLYAADLVGASVGALLGGALLAPVLGLPGTCCVVAVFSVLMAALLMTRVPKS